MQNNGCWDTMSIVRSYPGNFLFSHVILSLWSFEASKRRDPHYLTDMKIKFELTSSLIICIACGGPSNEKCFDKTQVFVICPYTLHQQIQTHQISQTVYLNSENWHWEFILDKIRTWESELLKGSSWECWPTSSEFWESPGFYEARRLRSSGNKNFYIRVTVKWITQLKVRWCWWGLE